MKAYVRKLFSHDLTHEVSVQSCFVWSFFKSDGVMTFVNVNNLYKKYSVVINNVTDPRFGGSFKSIYRSEIPRIGDFLIIRKLSNKRFSLQLVKKGSSINQIIEAAFDTCCLNERHAIIDI